MHDELTPVIDWLLARNPELDEIPIDLDLITNRVIDSLAFMEFVIFLEDLVGHELPATELTADQFRTLADIRKNFLM